MFHWLHSYLLQVESVTGCILRKFADQSIDSVFCNGCLIPSTFCSLPKNMCICSCILHGWYLMSQVLLLMHHPSHGRGLTSFCVSSLKTTRLISSIYILHDEHYVSQLGVNHVYYCICITTVIKYTVGYNVGTLQTNTYFFPILDYVHAFDIRVSD